MTETTTLSKIKAAKTIIDQHLFTTPLIHSAELSVQTGNNVYLKLENMQRTHAFKVRGALNKIASLSEAEKAKGVIAASSGNHAIGVSYAAQLYHVNATVVMPKYAPETKIALSKRYGAKVILYGETYSECITYAKNVSCQTGKVLVSSFDDLQVIYGHATIAMEVIESLPNVDLFLVPIGGGGLISGICLALTELKPSARVFGVESTGASSMLASIQAGKVTKLEEVHTIADGIAISEPGAITFNYVKQFVEGIHVVSDDEIFRAAASMIHDMRIIVEPASATVIAALLFKPEIQNCGLNVCVVITGGNISQNLLQQLLTANL